MALLTVTSCLCQRWLYIFSVFRAFVPLSSFVGYIIRFLIWVTRRLSLVEQELLIISAVLSLSRVAKGFVLLNSLCNQLSVSCIVDNNFLFQLFPVGIALSMRLPASDYLVGFSKVATKVTFSGIRRHVKTGIEFCIKTMYILDYRVWYYKP